MADKITLKGLVKNYVSNDNESEKNTQMSKIINAMNKSSNILPLIMVLGEFLTSATSNHERQSAILIIYQTLKQCASINLSSIELKTILNFLCSRFEHDLCCQSYILLTLCLLYNEYHSLLSSEKNNNNDNDGQILLLFILKTIIEKLDYEQIKMKIKYATKNAINYNQLSREHYLKMLNHALIHYPNVINIYSKDQFIEGCIKIMDSESDPRNILLLFNLFQTIFVSFSHQTLSKHIRTLFELIEVYFPIEFKAPKADNDLFGITKFELSQKLNDCFVCNPLLSSFALNMMFELMDDDEISANVEKYGDVICALTHCCNVYGIFVIQSYLKEIYDKMKSVILYGSDDKIIGFALLCIECIVGLICNNEQNGNIDSVQCVGWTTFLEPFINDFRSEIAIPDAKLARMSSKIIICISNSNQIAFGIVVKYLWTHIIDKYEQTKANKELISQKHALLELMSAILIGLKDLNGFNASIEVKLFVDAFVDILKNESDNDLNAKCIAIITLSYLCNLSPFILNKAAIQEIVCMIFNEFSSLCLKHQNDDKNTQKIVQFREILYNALSRISDKNAKIVLDNFVYGIAKYFKFDENNTNCEKLQCFFDCIAPICLQNGYIWHYVEQIVIKSMHKCLPQCIESKSSLICIKECLKTMSVILDYDDSNKTEKEIDRNENEKIIYDFLRGVIMEFAFEKLSNSKDEYELFLILTRVISKLICTLCNDLQLEFIQYSMTEIEQSIDQNCMNSYKCLINLICIASCKQKLLSHDKMFNFLMILQNHLLFSSNHNQNNKIMNDLFECIACLLNKSDSNKIIIPYLNDDSFGTVIKMIVENENCTCLYFIIWIVKALSIRCFVDSKGQKLKKLIEFLCNCLLSKNDKIAQIASFGFDVIMKESKLSLTKENECKISILYKQKFFVFVIEYILNMISKNDGKETTFLLLAVCYLMKNVPNAVLTSHLSNLLPLMIKSFESQLQTLRVSVLFLFEILLKSNLQCIVPYIDIVIPILLQLAKYKKSQKVRISALNCLLLMSGLEYSKLHKMTKNVIRSLSDVLDDSKKEVRIIGVECRNQWYLLHEE